MPEDNQSSNGEEPNQLPESKAPAPLESRAPETPESKAPEAPVKSSQAKPAKEPKSIDLAKLNKTTTTRAPAPTPIAGTVRTKVVASPMAKMNWKFSMFASIGAMFLGFATHIFGINGGLVLNDKYNLSFLMNPEIIERMTHRIPTEMLGVAPLSQPWLRHSLLGDLAEYKFTFIWYHVINVFWHAFSAGLLFYYVLVVARHLKHTDRLKVDPYRLAGATAILFACHPFTSEAVTYLSSRSALLGTVNYFQSLLFFLISASSKTTIYKAIFAFLALYTGAMAVWSNPEAVSLPAVALISLVILKHPLSKFKETVQDHPILLGLLLALSIAVPCLVMLPVQFTTAINLFLPTLSPMSYAASQVKAFVFYYLRCFLVPFGLSIDPPMALAANFSDPFAIGAAAAIAIATALVLRLKQPILLIAGALVLAGFLPHALMVQPDSVADWVAYLPLSGMMLFVAYGFCLLSKINLKAVTVAFSCVAALFCGLSIYQDYQWGSNTNLFQSALALRPKSAFLHANLAIEDVRRDELDDAQKEAKLAVQYGPDLALAQLAVAKVALAQNKTDDAKKALATCLSLASSQKLTPLMKTECRIAELQCLVSQRKEKEANDLLSKLFGEIPDDPRIMYVIGLASYSANDYEKAFKIFDKAVGTDPSVTECWRLMAECALALHAYDPAMQAAQTNLDVVGGPSANLLFARAAIVNKRESDAEEILKQMQKTSPKDARVLYLLSRLYKHNHKLDEWKKYREQATKLDPEVAVTFAVPELDAEDLAPPAGEQAPQGSTPAPGNPAKPTSAPGAESRATSSETAKPAMAPSAPSSSDTAKPATAPSAPSSSDTAKPAAAPSAPASSETAKPAAASTAPASSQTAKPVAAPSAPSSSQTAKTTAAPSASVNPKTAKSAATPPASGNSQNTKPAAAPAATTPAK